MSGSKPTTPVKGQRTGALGPLSGRGLLSSPSKADPSSKAVFSNKQLACLEPPFDWAEKARVVDLSKNQLQHLPEELSIGASSIQQLDLSHNRLETVPSVIFLLARLLQLDLGHNALLDLSDSQQQLAWSRLTCLQSLSLSHNPSLSSLDGILDLRHSLAILSLAGCSGLRAGLFSASFPAFQIAGLRSLDLSGLALTSLPAALASLEGLQLLYLNDNELESIPAEIIEALGGLREMQLARNRIHHLTPALANFYHIRQLQGNPIIHSSTRSPFVSAAHAEILQQEHAAAAEAQRERDQKVIAELHQQVAHLKSERSGLVQEKDAEIDGLRASLEERTAQRDEWNGRVEALEKEQARVLEEASSRDRQGSKLLCEAKTSADASAARIKALEWELKQTKEGLRAAEEEKEGLARSEEGLKVELEQVKAQLEATREELESSESTLKTTELINARLEEAIMCLREHQKQTDGERVETDQKISGLEDENHAIRQKATALQEQLDQVLLKGHQEEKDNRKKVKTEQISSLEESLSQKDARITALEEEVAEFEGTIGQLTKSFSEKIAKKEKKITDWIASLAELSKSLDTTQKELELVRAQLAASEEARAGLEARVFELQSEVARTTRKVLPSARQFRASSLRRDPNNPKLPKASEIQGELNVALDELDSTKTRLGVAEEQLEMQKNSIVNLTEHVHKLESQIKTMQQHSQQSGGFFSSGPSAKDVVSAAPYLDLLGRFQTELSENHALKDQLGRLRKENENLKAMMPSSSSEE